MHTPVTEERVGYLTKNRYFPIPVFKGKYGEDYGWKLYMSLDNQIQDYDRFQYLKVLSVILFFVPQFLYGICIM